MLNSLDNRRAASWTQCSGAGRGLRGLPRCTRCSEFVLRWRGLSHPSPGRVTSITTTQTLPSLRTPRGPERCCALPLGKNITLGNSCEVRTSLHAPLPHELKSCRADPPVPFMACVLIGNEQTKQNNMKNKTQTSVSLLLSCLGDFRVSRERSGFISTKPDQNIPLYISTYLIGAGALRGGRRGSKILGGCALSAFRDTGGPSGSSHVIESYTDSLKWRAA